MAIGIDRLEEAVAAKCRRIMALEEENVRLKDAQCGGMPGAAVPALPFKSGTPSSKIPVKPNSSEEDRRRVGEPLKRHAGHRRMAVLDEEADEVVDMPKPTSCPAHGIELVNWTTRATH